MCVCVPPPLICSFVIRCMRVALACACTHPPTHLLTHSLSHPPTHSPAHLLTHLLPYHYPPTLSHMKPLTLTPPSPGLGLAGEQGSRTRPLRDGSGGQRRVRMLPRSGHLGIPRGPVGGGRGGSAQGEDPRPHRGAAAGRGGCGGCGGGGKPAKRRRGRGQRRRCGRVFRRCSGTGKQEGRR
jgi:hypothetical protein